ncbi:MAG: DNA translocase FtsK 4TM domain-containing protein [Clostridia bacterium]|nr:DNA translocase FtsK 4TM domain-containing protein [Clostridia bacterium]
MARKKTTKKTVTKTNKKNNGQKEYSDLTALLIVAVGLIWAAFLYIPSGIIGPHIREFFLGLMGYPVFVMPIIAIVYGIHMAVGKGFAENIKKYYITSGGVLFLSSIVTLFSLTPENPFTSVPLYWYYGKTGIGGGVLGGILCDIFANLFGSVVAGIILFVALIIIIMVLTKWSPLKALLRAVILLYYRTKKARQTVKDEVENIKHQQLTVEDVKKQKKQKMQVFDDDEITTDKLEDKAIDGNDIVKRPYDDEDYIPPSLRDVIIDDEEIIDIDSIVNTAVPEIVKDEEIDHKENVIQSHYIEEETSDNEDSQDEPLETEAKELIPEKVTGMEDVTEEIEQAFERIPYTFPDLNLLMSHRIMTVVIFQEQSLKKRLKN